MPMDANRGENTTVSTKISPGRRTIFTILLGKQRLRSNTLRGSNGSPVDVAIWYCPDGRFPFNDGEDKLTYALDLPDVQ